MFTALIVEDDPPTAEKIISLCLKLNIEPTHSSSALEAISVLEESSGFSLALVDLMLPPSFKEEGLDVLRELKKSTSAEVIMFSARQDSMIPIVDRARSIGARKFIDKSLGELFFLALEAEIKSTLKGKANIFISHGRNETLNSKLKEFLINQLNKKPLVLSEYPDRGKTAIEKLESASLLCDSAIIIMSADDLQVDGGVRAQQNVIHELGFFQAKYGRNRTILLIEKGIERFDNISGIVCTEFDKNNFEACFDRLRIELSDFHQHLDLTPRLRALDQRIERIEINLRGQIDTALHSDASLLPTHVNQRIEGRIQAAIRNAALNPEEFKKLCRRLEYSDLRELQDTILSKTLWPLFEPRFTNKDTLAAKFDQLANLRNCVRHSRPVDEITRNEGEAAILWFERLAPLTASN